MNRHLTATRRRLVLGAQDALYTLSEGNPGALSVIVAALKRLHAPHDTAFLLDLDDMNVRGAQIWVAYNDICRRDLVLLVERARRRDPELVAAINRIIPDGERAVTGGGSLGHV